MAGPKADVFLPGGSGAAGATGAAKGGKILGLPRWAFAAAVVGGILVAFLIFRQRSSSSSDTSGDAVPQTPEVPQDIPQVPPAPDLMSSQVPQVPPPPGPFRPRGDQNVSYSFDLPHYRPPVATSIADVDPFAPGTVIPIEGPYGPVTGPIVVTPGGGIDPHRIGGPQPP